MLSVTLRKRVSMRLILPVGRDHDVGLGGLVGEGIGVGVQVDVGKGVGDGVKVCVGVGGVTPGTNVFVGRGVAVWVGVGVSVGTSVGVKVGVGVGLGLTREQFVAKDKIKRQARRE